MDPNPLPPKRHNDAKCAVWNMEGSRYKLTSSKEGSRIVYKSDGPQNAFCLNFLYCNQERQSD